MFDDGDLLVGRAVARVRELSKLHAALLTDLVAIADASPNAEFAGFEISSAFTWTRQAAAIQLEVAHSIVRRLPAVHAAMAAGEVDLPKARVIADGVAMLDLALANRIVAAILPLAPGLTTGELRARLAKLVIQADPDAADKRHRKRIRDRRVELQPGEDSCATLLAMNLPAPDAIGVGIGSADVVEAAGGDRGRAGGTSQRSLLRGSRWGCSSMRWTWPGIRSG